MTDIIVTTFTPRQAPARQPFSATLQAKIDCPVHRASQIEYHSDAYLDTLVDGCYTQYELASAFTLIANKSHWKDPIKATIARSDLGICHASAVHFTGGGIDEVSANEQATPPTVTVSGEGYYIHVGS
jgi:hypothetical protein